jgi:cell division septum initiation protein DivIVA
MERVEKSADQKRSGEMQESGFGGFGTSDSSKKVVTDQKRSGEAHTGDFGGFGQDSFVNFGNFGNFGAPDSSTKPTGNQLFDSGQWPSTPTGNNNNNNNNVSQQEGQHRAAKHRRDDAPGVLQPTRLAFDTNSSSSQGQTFISDYEKLIRENERLRVENERLRANAERVTSWSQKMQEESDHQQAVALQKIERLEHERAQLSQKVRDLSAELQRVRDHAVQEAEHRRAMEVDRDNNTKTIVVDAVRREFEGLTVDRQPKQAKQQQQQQQQQRQQQQQQRSFQQPQGAPHPPPPPYNYLHGQRPMEDRQQQPFRQPHGAPPPYAYLQELKGRSGIGNNIYDDRTDERRQRVQQQEVRFDVKPQINDDDRRAALAQLELSRKILQEGK